MDKAKIEVTDKLSPPTLVKGIRSYKRFIKNFSKIAKPLCILLEHDKPFNFDDDCLKAFVKLKKALVKHLLSQHQIGIYLLN